MPSSESRWLGSRTTAQILVLPVEDRKRYNTVYDRTTLQLRMFAVDAEAYPSVVIGTSASSMLSGAGDPNGTVTGAYGQLYYRTSNATIYVCVSSPSGMQWVDTMAGADFQESVLAFYDPTAGTPVGPAVGDRYISLATAHGWTADHIYEWTGASWRDTAPNEGMIVEVEDLNQYWTYNGVAWVLLPSLFDHGSLAGLQDDDHNNVYPRIYGRDGSLDSYADLTATHPPAVGYRGNMAMVMGAAGSRDRIYVCMKGDAGGYLWVEVANGGM